MGEILAHRIKGNPDIQGIKMGKNAVKNVITQFADDTSLYLIYSETTLNAAISELMYIETNTGLKVSYDKTCVYRLGSLKHTNAKIYTTKELKWSNGDIDMLGVKIVNTENQSLTQFNDIIQKAKNVAKSWSK